MKQTAMSDHNNPLTPMLARIVSDPSLHSRWLNTLSMMESVGARKIAASAHPVLVDELVLKHAAEEARHAHYLKRQVRKVDPAGCPDFAPQYLIAGRASYRYLHALDIRISRFLKQELKLSGRSLRYAAYLLVTYAIEVRARHAYRVYEDILKDQEARVSLRGILAEEEQHLAEMTRQMQVALPDWERSAQVACDLEAKIYSEWLKKVEQFLALEPCH